MRALRYRKIPLVLGKGKGQPLFNAKMYRLCIEGYALLQPGPHNSLMYLSVLRIEKALRCYRA